MSAALFGYAVGMFLAAGGVGYILMLTLKVLRVEKHWPRLTYVVCGLFVLLIGFVTAGNAGSPLETAIAIVVTICAAGVVAFYRSPLTKRSA